ncbi:MAG: hypothetical protein WC911_03605 [Thermoleophilia bacterium]
MDESWKKKKNRTDPLPFNDDREPWTRQKGETNKAFEAFVLYRDMGTSRSCAKVADHLSRSNTLIFGWSAKWSWQRRVELYDVHQDQERLKRLEQSRIKMDERQATYGKAMQAKGMIFIQGPDGGPQDVNQAAKLVVEGSKIERVAHGAPSEVINQQHTGADGGPIRLANLSDEELDKEIERELGRAGTDEGSEGPPPPAAAGSKEAGGEEGT